MSKLPWFRTYIRMVDDDKLKLLAFEDRWHFVALLCLKGEGLLDKGDAPALLMRSDTDNTAAERKRRQRQRKKDADSEGEDGGHEQVTGESRVTGTYVTRTDTDIDKEETVNNLKTVGAADRDTSPAAPSSQARMTAKTATGTRLPDDWKLPKSWGEWAIAEHPALTEDEIRRQAAMFADHWHGKAGKDGRKADWGATWRNWIRRAVELPSNRRPSLAPATAAGGKHAGAMAAILGGLQRNPSDNWPTWPRHHVAKSLRL